MAKVNVYVTLKPSLLDAQGKVVQGALENLGYGNIESVRMGKFGVSGFECSVAERKSRNLRV